MDDRNGEGFRTPALCGRAGLDAGPAFESLVRRKPRGGGGAVCWSGPMDGTNAEAAATSRVDRLRSQV